MALNNLTVFGQSSSIVQVSQNVEWFLRDAMLNRGGYFNITSGMKNYEGNDISLLKPSYQPEHSNFQFWKGNSHQWIWESGANTNATYTGGADTILVSGVYISDTFYPTGNLSIPFYIDYNRGGVVFNSPRPSSDIIRCDRSERASFVYDADSNEYRTIMKSHLRGLSNTPGSGTDAFAPELSVFLPAIFVSVSNPKNTPYQLGDSSQFKDYKIDLDIFAENKHEFDFLRGFCQDLYLESIEMFDYNDVLSNNELPLDYLGRFKMETSNVPAREITALGTKYNWRKGVFLENTRENIFPNILPIHRARVSLEFQIVI